MSAPKTENPKRAAFVRKQREARAWPQSQLAEVAGVSIRTIQRLERDGSARSETLMGVAQAFDMDVKYLNEMSKSNEEVVARKHLHLLPRLTVGRDLTNIVVGTDQFQIEHDEDSDPRSIQAMKGILELVKHDIVRLHDADPAERLRVEEELTQEISGLEAYGYFLFGIRRVIPRVADRQGLLMSMATVYMSHTRSPKLVKDKAYMVIPAVLTEVGR
jgi:transcriptional regulator with XRE-family HTH domain